ncbi:MAG: serine protease AprX [Solirubrobacteraceae bacterium]|nr:serine protease AprX [Solirubrobacteraceae bacterium]
MSPELPAGTGLALVVLVALVAISVIGSRSGDSGGKPVAPSLVALSPLDGRSPREPAGAEQRVLVELPRPALADRSDLDALTPEQQSDYVRSLVREGAALRSALGARGVDLRDPVTFGRTWDGFAATVDTSDLAALSSLGVRAQPVRRFYPATSEPIPLPRPGGSSPASPRGGAPRPRAAPPADQAPVAVLDTGVDVRTPVLRGRAATGFDALERDANPTPGSDPRTPRRSETTGTALAGIVAAAGERVLAVRVAGFGSAGPDIHGTTDSLLLGLERAVDPDGNGATDDAVRVALVGVNAPYAGFGDSPEAQAARGAAKLGTLVVAPAGNEGPAQPPNGVVGSPAAARSALAVGATEDGAGRARVQVTIGKRALRGAAVLGGTPPAGSAPLAGPVDVTDPAALLARGPRLSGRVALVRAGANPSAQVAGAAAAGARTVLLAEPRPRRPLPLMPAGRVAAPVVGLTGAAATAALAAKAGAAVKFGRVSLERVRSGAAASAPAPFSSRGPAFDGTPKPDLLAPGAAVAALPGGGAALLAGTAVAAARVAVDAARLARARPAETVAGLREALVPAPSAEASGAAPAPPVPLGPIRLTHRAGKVVGVRFTLGAFDRGDPLAGGSRIQPASRLELALLDSHGALRRRLTPPGGARDLLPAEYAYTLPSKALARLGAGTYRFRATARAPRSEHATTGRSPSFKRP